MTKSDVLIANVETAINKTDFEALVVAASLMAESYRAQVRQSMRMEAVIHDLIKRLDAMDKELTSVRQYPILSVAIEGPPPPLCRKRG